MAMTAPLKLTGISAVSPSLSEVLRLCLLRAGLGRTKGTDQFDLGNPKAWLGTAYHEVLAAAGQQGEAADAAAVWERVIDERHQRAQHHPLDSRFGTPERWPGYHLIRAMALLRAAGVVKDAQASAGAAGSSDADSSSSGHERWLSAAGGRIVGRPDVLRGDAVIDYKTGDVFEDGENEPVKASYVRQLQLYAFLVKETTGSWPRRGVLLPMEGAPVEVSLDPATCKQIAQEALDRLEKYNEVISAGGEASRLASPSPSSCRWCAYQLICPAFWRAASEEWRDHGGSAAVGGPASSVPVPIHGGSARALPLAVDEGTEGSGEVDLAPLQPASHTALAGVHQGTRVRVVGLARRADETVTPTKRTVLARAEDLPDIVLAADAEGPEI